MYDSTTQSQALFPAPGKLRGHRLFLSCQPRHVQYPTLSFAKLCSGETVKAPVEIYVLLHSQVIEKRELLGHVPDTLLCYVRFQRHVVIENAGITGSRLQEAGNHADSGSLPGTVRTQKPEDFTPLHSKTNRINCRELTELPGQTVDTDSSFFTGSLFTGNGIFETINFGRSIFEPGKPGN